MISEDLAPLIARSGKLDDLGFHSGRVLAFNTATGSNTVDVAGTPLADLPLLNIGDTTNIEVGDVVALLRYKSTMFIVGRVIQPGAGVAVDAVDFDGFLSFASGWSVSTSETTQTSQLYTVPPWSSGVQLDATSEVSAKNDNAAAQFLYTKVEISINSGAFLAASAEMFTNPDAGKWGYVSSSFSQAFTAAPGDTFEIRGQVMASAALGAQASNRMQLTTRLIYRRRQTYSTPIVTP